MKASLVCAAALAVAVACLWVAAAPAAAECNDRWQQAKKLTGQAQALYDQRQYSLAAQAFETAALSWQRAAGDCTRAESDTARINYQNCLKNAQLMVCLESYDAAQAVADKALGLAGQGKWREAEKTYMQAEQDWLKVAKGCDSDNAKRAKRNAREAAKNALTASDNDLVERRRGR